MTPCLPLNRFEVVEAYYWYDVQWGPTEYHMRVHHLGFSPGAGACFEHADRDVKWRYGRIVMEHNRLYVGYERLYRKAKGRAKRLLPPWPGTRNMGTKGAQGFLESQGLIDAVHAVTGGCL